MNVIGLAAAAVRNLTLSIIRNVFLLVKDTMKGTVHIRAKIYAKLWEPAIPHQERSNFVRTKFILHQDHLS